MRTIGRKNQEKFENFWPRFVGVVVFCNICSHAIPHGNENEKYSWKIKKNTFFFSKIQKTSGGMTKPQLKFYRNSCNRFRDNRCHRQTGEFRFHELCWHGQLELKYVRAYGLWEATTKIWKKSMKYKLTGGNYQNYESLGGGGIHIRHMSHNVGTTCCNQCNVNCHIISVKLCVCICMHVSLFQQTCHMKKTRWWLVANYRSCWISKNHLLLMCTPNSWHDSWINAKTWQIYQNQQWSNRPIMPAFCMPRES